MAKNFLKSKTFWMGIATIATGIGLYLNGEQELQELVLSIVGVIFTALRFITDKPLALK